MDSEVPLDMSFIDQFDADEAFLSSLSSYMNESSFPIDSSTVPSSIIRSKKPAKVKRRLKNELDYLRVKVKELLDELEGLQGQNNTNSHEKDAWEIRARQQALLVQQSLQENKYLKEAIQGQIALLNALQSVMLKQPKLAPFPTTNVQWKQAILGITQREATLEALMQHQYDKLDTEWISNGVYEALSNNKTIQKATLESNAENNGILLKFLRCSLCPLDHHKMATILWNHLTVRPVPISKEMDTFHDDLVYSREDVQLQGLAMPTIESRLVSRRWIQNDRIVIVWRSIIQDHLYPHEPTHLIENAWGWAATYARSPTECYLSVYLNMTPPIFPCPLQQPPIGTLTEMLLKVTDKNRDQVGEIIQKAVTYATQFGSGMTDDITTFLSGIFDAPKPRTRVTPRAQLDKLQCKRQELQRRLDYLNDRHKQRLSGNKWKAQATTQAILISKARAENKRLKHILKEQQKLMHTMQLLCRKHARLPTLSSINLIWTQPILGVSNRESTLETLLQLQYERLDGEWINSRMFDVTERKETLEKIYADEPTNEVKIIRCSVHPVPLQVMTDLVWQLMKYGPKTKNTQLDQTYHRDLIYVWEEVEIGNEDVPLLDVRSASRRYVEPNRIVIVRRSILQDELHPSNDDHYMDNHTAWIVIEPKGVNECYLAAYGRIHTPLHPPTINQAIKTNLTELLLQLVLACIDDFTKKIDFVQVNTNNTERL